MPTRIRLHSKTGRLIRSDLMDRVSLVAHENNPLRNQRLGRVVHVRCLKAYRVKRQPILRQDPDTFWLMGLGEWQSHDGSAQR